VKCRLSFSFNKKVLWGPTKGSGAAVITNYFSKNVAAAEGKIQLKKNSIQNFFFFSSRNVLKKCCGLNNPQ
jgi:hypothetical protein